jgi:hypothetical protein
LVPQEDSLPALELNENTPDQWKPDWGKDYTAKRFYTMVYDLFQAHPIFKLVWKSRCTPRIKFLIWLILVDRLNTKTMLSRRHIGEKNNDHCVLCSLGEMRPWNISFSYSHLQLNAGVIWVSSGISIYAWTTNLLKPTKIVVYISSQKQQ